MTKTYSVLGLKGAAVSALAATAAYWIWTAGREWAQGVGRAGSDAFLAGALESVLATVAGVAAMPLLLWAGRRAVRERGNHLMVIGCSVAWPFAGGYVVENDVGAAGTLVVLTLFALLGGLLAVVGLPET
ncbi:hypothetical protein AB0K47_29015 [Streptomyces tirandamycinicus]|uniref:hypothetical protein n=1 Tax=Streptomyces tirandamycinicus TaxID=2174846 RepID=UPI00036EEAD2